MKTIRELGRRRAVFPPASLLWVLVQPTQAIGTKNPTNGLARNGEPMYIINRGRLITTIHNTHGGAHHERR